ncbi:uncharacterized protein LOC135223488 [Macrobrachium nipponense]|uniref:uncharacterized protein LOC135223488 n=1 Tax=Macrobrachium nipponense TaxID=159736 RepID=UPI0030C82C57
MAKLPNLDRLTTSTLSYLDNDDFMEIINKLIVERESLQSSINQKVMEFNTWISVLQTSTMEEARDLIDMLPETSVLSAEEIELLYKYKALSREAKAYSAVDFCNACLTEEGDLLLQFSSPFPIEGTSNFSIWLNTNENNEYGVKYHNLPDTIPVAELLEKYSKNGKGNALKKFSTAIKQYLWPIFNREYQARKYEKSDAMPAGNYVYRNEDCTLMSFIMPVQENEKSAIYEFVLKYQILDILPYEVKLSVIKKDGPYAILQNEMKDLAEEMKDRSFAEALAERLGTKTTPDVSENTDQSSDTLNFELFT